MTASTLHHFMQLVGHGVLLAVTVAAVLVVVLLLARFVKGVR